ncbi:MAG: hypothetical protein MHM6MM_006776, partial [Cercozoa sp. M6MM]
MSVFLLFESAAGYALFERISGDEIGAKDAAAQRSLKELSKFSKMVKLSAFQPFSSPQQALESINALVE